MAENEWVLVGAPGDPSNGPDALLVGPGPLAIPGEGRFSDLPIAGSRSGRQKRHEEGDVLEEVAGRIGAQV